jgi:hypothetical protein
MSRPRRGVFAAQYLMCEQVEAFEFAQENIIKQRIVRCRCRLGIETLTRTWRGIHVSDLGVCRVVLSW